MPKTDELSQSLLAAAEVATDSAEKVSLIGAVKALAETDKLAAEAGKLKEDTANVQRLAKADARRFTITVLAPSISALAVVMAIGVQVYQTNRNAELQRELNEASSLREALKLTGSSKTSEAYAGALFLTSMLNSQSYGGTVRSISINVLSHTAEPNSFEALFGAIAASTTTQNIGDLSRLSRNLTNGLVDARNAIDDIKAGKRPRGLLPQGVPPEMLDQALNDEVRIVARAIISIVRRAPTTTGVPLDLAGANLSSQELDDLSLAYANISDTTFRSSTVGTIDLTGVTSFEGSDWEDVEWWRAKSVSAGLLDYLKKKFPYSPDRDYVTPKGSQKSSASDYERELQRLAGKAKQ